LQLLSCASCEQPPRPSSLKASCSYSLQYAVGTCKGRWMDDYILVVYLPKCHCGSTS
jgi:hypothetical protein